MPNGRAHSGKLVHDPIAQKTAISMLAVGRTQEDVGEAIGVKQPAISQWAKSDDVRKRIEQETINVLKMVPDAVQYAKTLLEDGRKAKVHPHMVEYEVEDPESGKKIVMVPASPKDIANAIKLRGLGYEVARDVLKSSGILPTNTESRIVIAFLSGEAAEGLTPMLSQLMGQVIGTERAKDALVDAIDITPEEGD